MAWGFASFVRAGAAESLAVPRAAGVAPAFAPAPFALDWLAPAPFAPAPFAPEWAALEWAALDWAALDWAAPDWAALVWAALDWEIGRAHV